MVGGLLLAACSPEPPPRFIVVVVDMLRPDHLGVYGYGKETSPNLDRWAEEGGVIFDRAYSAAPWTYPSTVSLLTGLYPSEHEADQVSLAGGRLAVSQPANPEVWLPPSLAAAGYSTAGFHTHRYLHRSVSNIHQAFQTYVYPPQLEVGEVDWTDQAGGWRELQELDTLYPPFEGWLREHHDKPFFVYLHVLDVHGPYARLRFLDEDRAKAEAALRDGSAAYPALSGNPGLYVSTDDANPHKAWLYDGHVRQVDDYLGRLRATLEELDIADHTYVIFTADHGEGFGEHGYWGHGATVDEGQIRVPLIWLSHRRLVEAPRRVDALVNTVGLLPTMAELAGVSLDGPPAGRGFAALLDDEPTADPWPYVSMSETTVRGGHDALLTGPRLKLVTHLETREQELCDLIRDPAERRCLQSSSGARDSHPDHRRMDELRGRLLGAMAGEPVNYEDLEPTDVEALRALGYLR